MENITKAFQEVLKYLHSNRGISNSAAYKQMGFSDNQGKARKRGTTLITEQDLCLLASTFPDILAIMSRYGIKCGNVTDAKASMRKILEDLNEIKRLTNALEEQIKANL